MARLRLRARVDRQALEQRLEQIANPIRETILDAFPSLAMEHIYREAMEAAIYSTPPNHYERSFGLLDSFQIERSEVGFTISVNGEEAFRINKAKHPTTPDEEIEGYWIRSATDANTWALSGHGYFNFLVTMLWQDIMQALRTIPGISIRRLAPPEISMDFNTHHGTHGSNVHGMRRYHHVNAHGNAGRPDVPTLPRMPQTPSNPRQD